MTFYRKILGVVVMLSLVCFALPAVALDLIGPTDMQIVREKVAITVPEDSVPDDGFLSLYVAATDQMVSDNFFVALSSDDAVRKDGKITFFWNTKSSIRSDSNPKEEKKLKDGVYTIRVNVHNYTSKIVDHTTLKIDLRNKIARPSPAPAVALQNKLAPNQSNEYDVKAFAEIYSDQDTPILGGVNLAASMGVYQTVEDVWPDGSRLLKYRLSKDTYVASMGALQYLYPNAATRPQLYKLVNTSGKVVNENVFKRQRMFSVMDLLPVLPANKVKEGDSWDDKMVFKVDGVTENLELTGKAVLDSFEWEQGKQCAKVISNLSSDAVISLLNGRLISDKGKVNAQVISYIAYQESKCVKREITLEFAALIQQGLESGSGMRTGAPGFSGGAAGGPGGVIPMGGGSMPGMMGPGMPMGGPPPGLTGPGMPMGGPPTGMMGPGMPMGGPPTGMMGPGMQDGAIAGAVGAAMQNRAMLEDLLDDNGDGAPRIGMPGMGMPGMGSGATTALSLNNADKGSVKIKVDVLLVK